MTGIPVSLARRSNIDAHSLICDTDPGEDSIVCVYIVCIESTIMSSGSVFFASANMFSISVSLYIRQSSPSPPSLVALSFTCRALSSPVTYRVRSPRQCRGICRDSVDFPMPGSPAMSTRDPFTIPPPRSLSISELCRVVRLSSVESISLRDRGRDEVPTEFSSCLREAWAPVTTFSSTIVFHSPHAGQRPIHFGLSFPHDEQNQTDFVFRAILISVLQIPKLTII